MNSKIFREYDIRGKADSDLTSETVQKIGRGLAARMPKGAGRARPMLIVSRDCRLSGPRLFDALTEGLMSGGADVVDIGVGPTPQMYFAVHELDADGGVMITGSHNPKDENGLKIMIGKASFFGDQIQELKLAIERDDLPSAETAGTLSERDVSEDYLQAVTSGIRIGDPNITVVVDGGNGSAGPLGCQALRRVGLNPIELYCDMDGEFPNHHPDPADPHSLEKLIATLKEHQAAVGLAWDGDGDRLGVIDMDGEIVWGDRLLALFARNALRDNPGGKVIGDVKCSQTLFDDVEKHGGIPLMSRTGHSLIKALMKKEGAMMAGEMSGHFFFADRYKGYDDAIYTALRMVEILSQEKKPIAELLADMPKLHYTPEINIKCTDEAKFDVVDSVKRHFESQDVELTTIDGVRFTHSDGSWGLVRASNTGPRLVLRFEAHDAEQLERIKTETVDLVRRTRGDLGGDPGQK
jgi:phosphomannomutase/phosphoglucomutase